MNRVEKDSHLMECVNGKRDTIAFSDGISRGRLVIRPSCNFFLTIYDRHAPCYWLAFSLVMWRLLSLSLGLGRRLDRAKTRSVWNSHLNREHPIFEKVKSKDTGKSRKTPSISKQKLEIEMHNLASFIYIYIYIMLLLT